MKILITGGAGFLGSHLCDKLLAQDHEIVCLDNLFTSQKSNIAHLLGRPNFEFVRHDVIDPFKYEVDQIYNLACPAAPGHYQYNPIKTMKTSFLGAMNCLGLAKRLRARIFHASTSEVYGDPLVHPQPEGYWGNVSSIGPRSCYDEAKRFSEALTMAYHRVHGVEVRIVRIFNTYGERMRPNDGRVVNTFVVQALRGEPLTLHGDGSQTRSFCHVSDEVRGLTALLDSDYNLPVNVGNPSEFTMRELAEIVIELTGSSSEIISVELPPERDGDPLQRKPDITLAKQLLNWEPDISLRDGLERMIKHFIEVEGIS